MPSTVGLALNFSGGDLVGQQAEAEQALRALPATAHGERARLQAILAAALVVTDADGATAAAAAAEVESRAAGDETARAWALLAGCIVDLSCVTTAARLDATREVLRIARETGDDELVPTAFFLHLAALAELGETAELDLALSPVGPLLAAFPWLDEGRHAAWFRCLRATIDGQTERAEAFADRGYALAAAAGDPDALSVRIGQLSVLAWLRGTVVEYEPAFLAARQAAPHEPIWAACLAWVWLRQGREQAARGLLATLPPVADLPIDRNWLATAAILSDAAADLGELDIARELYAALLPYEGRLVTIGLGVTCWGTVSRPLARIAAALGDRDTAIAHYRAAIETAGRRGAHAWLAEAQWELAELLAARGGPGGLEEALALALEATATGRALQLHGIEGGATAVLEVLEHRIGLDPEPVSTSTHPQIRVLGDFAVVSADGRVAQWQSRKARQLLGILVAKRGAAISRESAMHMLWPDEAPDRVANRLSVATTVVRRAIDPDGTMPTHTYVDSRGGLLRLRIDELDVDVERFLTLAHAALDAGTRDDARRDLLAAAVAMYAGDPMTDEVDELWAAELRREAHTAFFAVAHAHAERAAADGDHRASADAYRRILALDGYDQRAHEAHIDALTRLGAHRQAAEARADYLARMRELGIPLLRADATAG